MSSIDSRVQKFCLLSTPYLCECKREKSAPNFDGSKVINYCGHFVLCSEEFVNKWDVEVLEKRRS